MHRLFIRLAWSHSARWVFTLVGATVMVFSLSWLFDSHITAPIDSYAECVAAGNPVELSSPPICHADGQVFVGAIESPAPSVPVAASQEFQLLVDADSHGVYPYRQEVITTAEQWQRYWREVHAGLPSVPPLLPVDFSASMVVALSLGAHSTGGYQVKVADILASSAGTTVDVTETSPGPQCVVTATPTNPYYVVRTHRLPEPVSFRITREIHHC